MTPLNLPPFEIALRDSDAGTEVYDPLRRKWVALTPEEWVRQHFVNFLVADRGFPSVLMANEIGLKLNSMTRRCDSVVFDQIARYNMVLDAPLLVVSNGLRHYCCRFDRSAGTYAFLRDIPYWSAIAP